MNIEALIRRGDLEAIEELFKRHVVGLTRTRCCELAIEAQNLDLLLYFDPAEEDLPALSRAAERSHSCDIVEYIRSRGHCINLLHLLESNCLSCFRCQFVESDDKLGRKGQNSLIWRAVASEDRIEILGFMLESGAVDVNTADGSKRNLLAEACMKGHYEVSKFLLSRGATIELGKSTDWNVVHAAVYGRNHDIVEMILDSGGRPHSENLTPLILAAGRCETRTLQLLIDRGADVNSTVLLMGDQISAITEAVAEGRLENLKLLLHHGAKVDFSIIPDADRCVNSSCIDFLDNLKSELQS